LWRVQRVKQLDKEYYESANMRHLNQTKQTVYITLMCFLFLLTGFIIAGRFGLGGIQALVVQSGSMEPSIHTKSIVFVAPVNAYSLDDVITFKQSGRNQVLVTHRVVGLSTSQPTLFTTKGDANEEADAETVPLQDVVGKVIFSVPMLGRIVSFAQTTIGFISLVVIPATLIVYSEIIAIKNQLEKMYKPKIKTNYFRSV
jgi:signal peptidase